MAIEITWLGHSCFSIKGKGATLVTDPYEDSIGYTLGSLRANIVTSSHAHPGHGCISGVSGEPKAIYGPGEYEVSRVFITGIATFHDAEGGRERGRNTAYLIEMEDLRLCHLGDLGHTLSAAQAEEIAEVHVLMVPVGGVSTIDAVAAAEVVRQLQPGIVIPMHYKTESLSFELEPVERFLKEMGVKTGVEPQQKLSVTRASLPEETQVVVMSCGTAG